VCRLIEIGPGTESENTRAFPALSKRAARRVIQRAFVLVGRDKHVRQHLRAARVTTLWIIEDWNLSWTVVLSRGRIEFARRPTKKPDLTFAWRAAEDFFRQIEAGKPAEEACQCVGDEALRKFSEPVCQAFCRTLSAVLRNPVDDDGEPLL